jgi:hypothetical protein
VPSGKKRNPRQPHKRVRKALKKYVASQVGIPTQYTPAKVRVNPKGGLDIKFASPPKGKTKNPRGFSVSAKNPMATYELYRGSHHFATVEASSSAQARKMASGFGEGKARGETIDYDRSGREIRKKIGKLRVVRKK